MHLKYNYQKYSIAEICIQLTFCIGRTQKYSKIKGLRQPMNCNYIKNIAFSKIFC